MVRFRMRDWWGSGCVAGSGSICVEGQVELWSGCGCDGQDQYVLRVRVNYGQGVVVMVRINMCWGSGSSMVRVWLWWSGSGCVEEQGEFWSGSIMVRVNYGQSQLWSGSIVVRSRVKLSKQYVRVMWGDLDSVVRETKDHMINIKLLNINF